MRALLVVFYIQVLKSDSAPEWFESFLLRIYIVERHIYIHSYMYIAGLVAKFIWTPRKHFRPTHRNYDIFSYKSIARSHDGHSWFLVHRKMLKCIREMCMVHLQLMRILFNYMLQLLRLLCFQVKRKKLYLQMDLFTFPVENIYAVYFSVYSGSKGHTGEWAWKFLAANIL